MIRPTWLLALTCLALCPAFLRAQGELKPLHVLHGNDHKFVASVAISPDGKTFLACAGDGAAVLVVDTASGRRLATLGGNKNDFKCVAYSPDGNVVATGGGDQKVQLWSSDGWARKDEWTRHRDAVTCIAFSGDGKTLASGGADGVVVVCETQTGKVLAQLREPGQAIRSVAVSKDGSRLVSATDGRVKVWDVPKQAGTTTLEAGGKAFAGHRVAMTADGGRVAVSTPGGGAVTVWDAESGRQVAKCEGHKKRVSGLAFLDGEKALATSSWDGTVRAWDPATGEEKFAWKRQAAGVACVAASADGRTLIGGGGDGSVGIWAADDKAPARYAYGHQGSILCMRFREDGGLESYGLDKVFVSWQAGSGYAASYVNGYGKVAAIAYADKEDYKAAADVERGEIALLAKGKGAPIPLFGYKNGSDDGVVRLQFTADRKQLFSAHGDGGLRVWGTELAKLESESPSTKERSKIFDMDLSRDGKWLALCSGGALQTVDEFNNKEVASSYVELLDAATRKVVWQKPLISNDYKGTRHGFRVVAVRVTPDSKYVVAAGEKSIRVFDAQTGKTVASYTEQFKRYMGFQEIGALDLSPDGKYVAAGIEEKSDKGSHFRVRVLGTDQLGQGKLRPVGTGEGHAARPCTVVFRADGKAFATADQAGTICIWNTAGLN